VTSEENDNEVTPLSSGQGTPGDEAEIPARISVPTVTGGDHFPTVGRSAGQKRSTQNIGQELDCLSSTHSSLWDGLREHRERVCNILRRCGGR